MKENKGFGRYYIPRHIVRNCLLLIEVQILLIVFLVLLLAGCAGWTYNGIRGQDLRQGNGWKMAGGMLASSAVHMAGHIAAAESSGYLMKWLGYRNDFTRGYNAWCLVETAGYPILLRPFFSGGGDDLKFIDRHRGNSGIVWGVASALVIGLNIDQKNDRP